MPFRSVAIANINQSITKHTATRGESLRGPSKRHADIETIFRFGLETNYEFKSGLINERKVVINMLTAEVRRLVPVSCYIQ